MRQLESRLFYPLWRQHLRRWSHLAWVTLDDGSVWKNITTRKKSKVAETLTEFRGNYIYNLLDENIRRFNAQVPQLVQWDDHEVTNNWYPGEILTDIGLDVIQLKTLISSVIGQTSLQEYVPSASSRKIQSGSIARFSTAVAGYFHAR